MEISCDIIRDVLPLYAEDMVSGATRDMVDAHLCGCGECAEELAQLKRVESVPIEADVESLEKVRKTIRKRWIFGVLTAVCLVTTLILGGSMLMNATICLPEHMAVTGVEELEGGMIAVTFSDYVTGIRTSSGDGSFPGNHGIIAYTRLGKLLFSDGQDLQAADSENLKVISGEQLESRSVYQMEGGANKQNFWYCSPITGDAETLIWDGGQPYAHWMPYFSGNQIFGLYISFLLILCGLAHVSGYVMKRYWKPWLFECSFQLGAVFGCLGFSTILVTAGQYTGLDRDFWGTAAKIIAAAFCMWLTVLFSRKLYLLSHQEKNA